jgi:hypothetical protein
VRVATIGEPAAFEGGRTIHVDPEQGLMAAYQTAQAGDILLLHAGRYQGPFELRKSGRDQGDRSSSVVPATARRFLKPDGTGENADIVRISGADYLMFENLTFRNGRTAIYAGKPGSKNITVRNCL